MVDILGRKAQVFENFEGVVEAGRNGVSASEWQAAEAQREDRLPLGEARREVAGPHRQLVEISQSRQAGSIQVSYGGHLRSPPGLLAAPNVTRFGTYPTWRRSGRPSHPPEWGRRAGRTDTSEGRHATRNPYAAAVQVGSVAPNQRSKEEVRRTPLSKERHMSSRPNRRAVERA